MKFKKGKMNKGQYPEINSRFRDIRIDHRLTQAEMAAAVGLTAGAVGAIEQGLYTPNFSVLRILNKKFGVSYSFIIDGEKDDSDSLRKKCSQLEEENERLKRIVDKLT
jgi:transcriptional regulator with XRE-family HTH domain